MRGPDEEMIVGTCNLYQMNFTKVYGADLDAANSTQSLKKCGGVCGLGHRQFGHLNVNRIHALQNMMGNTNFGKVHCPTFSWICEGCIEGQHLRAAFSNNGKKMKQISLWR